MNTIVLKTATSYEVLPELRRIMKESWKLKEVRMDYNTKRLPDDWNINSYPVILVFEEAKEEFEVKILSFSVGYGGEGPTDFSRFLEFFEIPYRQEDIFTKKRMGNDEYIRLRYIL